MCWMNLSLWSIRTPDKLQSVLNCNKSLSIERRLNQQGTQREIDSEIYYMKPNSDFNYTILD